MRHWYKLLQFLIAICRIVPNFGDEAYATEKCVDDGSSETRDHFLHKQYCVVGAGPSGLQMGYFLEQAQRDYVIFEKSDRVGNFFVLYPRHRKLISINKRFTGRTNREFNLRHDWNSLLSDNDKLLFTKYSKDYFPSADRYLDYLADYHKTIGINVQFNTEIDNIRFHGDSDVCRFSMNDQHHKQYCCRAVLIGTGLATPVVPSKVKGLEHIEGYESVSIDPQDYEGKSVLIVGKGNSGFEMAASIYGSANYVHVVGRDRVKFSWDTHYVGDIRGVNNEVLDSYMLKSLDGVFETGAEELHVIKRNDGKLMLRSVGYTELNTLDQNPVREGYDKIIRCMGFTWDDSLFHNSTKPERFHRLHQSSGRGQAKKYPRIEEDFQSPQFPGMYFIGPLTHSLDYRKSAGGFIHGFRYNARALHRMLEWKYHGNAWESVSKPWDQLLATLLKRANEASGIYQMFQFLGDVAIINRNDETFTYLEEYPIRLISNLTRITGHEFHPDHQDLVVLTLEYGTNWSHAGRDHFGEDRAHGDVEDAHL